MIDDGHPREDDFSYLSLSLSQSEGIVLRIVVRFGRGMSLSSLTGEVLFLQGYHWGLFFSDFWMRRLVVFPATC